MINATEAAAKTAEKVKSMTAELEANIQKVLDAAISQGSCKATFYPRNRFDVDNAMILLGGSGYGIKVIDAKDQRDNDRIEISW